MAKVTKAALSAALAMIVAAGEAGTFTKPEIHTPLVAEGLVEINAAITNENGIATRATPAGIAKVNGGAAPEVPKAKPQFNIVASIPVPVASVGRTGTSQYPFDALEVGQSFFVPNEGEKDAAKSMASTVSSATQRYAHPDPSGATRTNRKGKVVPVMIEGRKFVCRSVKDGAPWGFAGQAGAGVWRTA